MKYLRTKDGRVIPTDYPALKDLVFDTWVGRTIMADGKESEVIAEADSLKDICDFFVIDWGDEYLIYPFLEWAVDKVGDSSFRESATIYGAVFFKGDGKEPILASVCVLKEGGLELL